MKEMNGTIFAPLIYYDLLERPLTALETFKYLRAGGPEISFFGLREFLKKTDLLNRQNGLYFLPGRQALLKTRQKRLKLAQLKWKKIKTAGRFLALSPFLRLAAVTGSLTAYNTKKASDLDLLVVLKSGRLWLGRLLLTGLVALIGQRRHGEKTQDRLCLNCYLADERLEITADAKPRDWHAAQEYSRLAPLLEIKNEVHENFTRQNQWLADFLEHYPWPNGANAHKIISPTAYSFFRRSLEWLLGGTMGDGLEKFTGTWQKKRINQKRRGEEPGRDQVFINDECLMFHPQSKSDKLMKEYNANIIRMNSK